MVERKTVIKSGLTKLDEMIGGFKVGELAIIAGRPSMGKTALLYTIINNGAVEVKENPYVVCFQPNLSAFETRFLLDCLHARVNPLKASRWGITKDEFGRLKKAHKKIFYDPIVVSIYDWPAVKLLSRMRKEVINLHKKTNLKVIAIDHLQSIKSDLRSPLSHKDTARICASLKRLAEQLNIAVILLSQLPRAVERRRPQIPRLSDLKEYGEIEKYADKILFLYREEYYVPTDTNKGLAKIIVAKNRSGHVGIVDVKFIRKYLRFDNI